MDKFLVAKNDRVKCRTCGWEGTPKLFGFGRSSAAGKTSESGVMTWDVYTCPACHAPLAEDAFTGDGDNRRFSCYADYAELIDPA